MQDALTIVLPMIPPTATAQQKGQRVVVPKVGKPFVHHFKKKELIQAERQYKRFLRPWKPSVPMRGPLRCTMVFVWPYRATERKSTIQSGALVLKDTKPDAGNVSKLLEDCMEELGFFSNDSQIANPVVFKFWGPVGRIVVDLCPAEITEDVQPLLKLYTNEQHALNTQLNLIQPAF